MKPQYITDGIGKKLSVILPISEYQKLLDELDELQCVKAYDKALSRKQEFIPFEEIVKQIRSKRKA